MQVLTREQIVEAARAAVRPKSIEVPEWGGAVHIRALPLGERMDYQREARAALNDGTRQPEDLALDLVLRSLCEADGAPLFTADDAELVRSFGHEGVLRIWREARKINGFLDAEELQAAAGN
jgi:hypothetical protein